ncbi:hypothetical protein KAX01_02590 [Candidatus Bathyarchaeota archaeon]|nr:hypothetical protein [Candidatus Bathyarchaeota archaeon]MCK4435599.1 hypothetical protein [Candidatus Bathyarchaeota archaeon]
MKRNSRVSIELPSKRMVKILLNALLPETRKPVTSRSKVLIEGFGKRLVIEVEAKDLAAFRATLNSYLRWVALIVDTYKTAERLEKNQGKNT